METTLPQVPFANNKHIITLVKCAEYAYCEQIFRSGSKERSLWPYMFNLFAHFKEVSALLILV